MKTSRVLLSSLVVYQQAIAAKSFLPPTRTLRTGDVAAAMETADHVIEGEFRLGGQEHFYLETQACLAVPGGEAGEMEVYCSVQAPNTAQVQIYYVIIIQPHPLLRPHAWCKKTPH